MSCRREFCQYMTRIIADGFTYTLASNFLNHPATVGLVLLDLAKAPEELLGSSLNVAKDIMSTHVLSSGESGSTCDHVTRVSTALYQKSVRPYKRRRRSVTYQGTRSHNIHDLLSGNDTRDRHSVGETLGVDHDVRCDTSVLDGKCLSCTSEPGLDLIFASGQLFATPIS